MLKIICLQCSWLFSLPSELDVTLHPMKSLLTSSGSTSDLATVPYSCANTVGCGYVHI